MAGRDDRGQRLAQFRLALDEHCDMAEAADRLRQREDAARLDVARTAHREAMARLRAKGWGARRAHD